MEANNTNTNTINNNIFTDYLKVCMQEIEGEVPVNPESAVKLAGDLQVFVKGFMAYYVADLQSRANRSLGHKMK